MLGRRQLQLLMEDVEGIQEFLDEFEPTANGELRYVALNETGELLTVRNFPLPDHLRPDHVDLLLLTGGYPAEAPLGIYLLERNNRSLIDQLRHSFNVMERAAYTAPTVPAFDWICWHFEGNRWEYCRDNLAAGDNIRKFLVGFYNQLCIDTGKAGQ